MFASLFNNWRLWRAEQKVRSLLRERASVYEVTQAVERLVHLAEQFLSEDTPQTASWQKLLGSFYREAGNPEAEPCLQRAVEATRRVFGPMDPRVAVVLNDLAAVCRILGRDVDKAESYYREALSIDKLAYGDRHQETLTDMNNLALLLWHRNDQARDDRARARALLEYVRTTDQGSYPPHHDVVAQDHLNWGTTVLVEEGDWSGAEREVRRALQIFQTFYPHRTIEIAGMLGTLATILDEQGDIYFTRL
jgi:tetratricopeptide (TPR) repeat protein